MKYKCSECGRIFNDNECAVQEKIAFAIYDTYTGDDCCPYCGSVKLKIVLFSEFVKNNKDKIDRITPKNPSIAIDDEWRKEDWD